MHTSAFEDDNCAKLDQREQYFRLCTHHNRSLKLPFATAKHCVLGDTVRPDGPTRDRGVQ